MPFCGADIRRCISDLIEFSVLKGYHALSVFMISLTYYFVNSLTKFILLLRCQEGEPHTSSTFPCFYKQFPFQTGLYQAADKPQP